MDNRLKSRGWRIGDRVQLLVDWSGCYIAGEWQTITDEVEKWKRETPGTMLSSGNIEAGPREPRGDRAAK
jgi:hypothetical protein